MDFQDPVLPVDAWTDFSCPYSFLTSLELRRLREELPLSIRWRSMLVRPPGLPPMTAEMRALAEHARREIAQRAKSQLGLSLNPGALGVDTLSAHLALQHAHRRGAGDALHEALMKAYWLDAAPLDDRPFLQRLAAAAGVDGPIPWDEPALAEAVDADLVLAQQLELYFAPALRFGRRTLVAGAEPYERLRDAARLASAAYGRPASFTAVPRRPPAPPHGS